MRMCLLLVVVFLFFSSSSCSVSSHQYYVSDNCSSESVTTSCAPLSVYARNISQYNNTIFYFIGESVIYDNNISMHFVNNITLHGRDHSPHINCSGSSFTISKSIHIFFFNISIYGCNLFLEHSSNVTMTSMKVSCASVSCGFSATNIFDFKVLASTFSSGFSPTIIFQTLSRCSSSELPHYTVNCTNVTIYDGLMRLVLYHGMSYNLTIILDQINSGDNGGVVVDFSDSLFSFAIINSSMCGSYYGLGLYYTPVPVCHFAIAQPLSSIAIENSHFFDNFNAALVISAGGIMKVQHIIVSVKSCVIHDSFYYGLQIDATFLPFLTISISDTELTSNGGQTVILCY